MLDALLTTIFDLPKRKLSSSSFDTTPQSIMLEYACNIIKHPCYISCCSLLSIQVAFNFKHVRPIYCNNKLTIAEYWFLEVGNPWFFNASNAALGYWSHVSVYNMFMLFEESANSIEMIQKRNVIYQKRESLGVKNTCFARIVLWL